MHLPGFMLSKQKTPKAAKLRQEEDEGPAPALFAGCCNSCSATELNPAKCERSPFTFSQRLCIHPASTCLRLRARSFVAPSFAGLQPLLDGRFNSSRLFLQMKLNPFHRPSTKIKTSCKPCRTQLMNGSKQRAAVQGCLKNDELPFQTSEGCKNITSS